MEIQEILRMNDRAAAYIDLVRLYFDGGEAMRNYIVQNWDFGVQWELPNQARLACQCNERWSRRVRLEASLAYSAISAKQHTDYRDELIALAVIYQSCIAAAINAYEIFEKVAQLSAPPVKELLQEFLARSEEDKSLASFMLLTEKNKDGEIEIRPKDYT